MARASFVQTQWHGGEWSAYMHGRTDLPDFVAALKTCENFIPGDRGGIRRRRGFQQEYYTGKKTARARLIPYINALTNNSLTDANFFVFPTTMLTVGDLFITTSRVTGEITLAASNNTKTVASVNTSNPVTITTTMNHGWSTNDIVSFLTLGGGTDTVQSQITVTGLNTFTVPWPGAQLQNASLVGGAVNRIYKCVTTYSSAMHSELDYAQVGVNMWFFHPTVAPAYNDFSGSGAPTAAVLTTASLLDGPYMDVNLTTTTLTPSGLSGSITIVASAVTGINQNTGFQTTDVGRIIRLQDSAGNWTWVLITARGSTTSVTATVMGAALADTAATSSWRPGLFSDTTSWPYTGAVYQDRLYLAHKNSSPISADRSFAIVASRVGLYTDFTPTSADGTVADADALTIILSDAGATKVSWFYVTAEGLLVGTPVGGYNLSGTALGEPITPTNIQPAKVFNLQCDRVRPVPTPTGTAFVHSSRTKISEYMPGKGVFELTARSRDLIAPAYFAELAWQRSPQHVLWARTTDDKLYGAAYIETGDEPNCGWFSAPLSSGHTVEALGMHLYQDDSAVIHEDLRMIVKVGTWRRHMVSPYYANIEAITDLIPGILNANHNFGNMLYVDEMFLQSVNAATTFYNFQTLASQTIKYFYTGVPGNDIVVDGDGQFEVPLSAEGSFHSFGQTLRSRFQLLRPEAGAANGPALGKTRRIDQFAVLINASGGFRAGASFSDMFESELLPTPTTGPTTGVLQRFSGVFENQLQADYNFDNEIAIEMSKPTPGLFMAIAGFVSLQDR